VRCACACGLCVCACVRACVCVCVFAVCVCVRVRVCRAMLQGLSTNLLRVVPSAAITFVVYEKIAALLGAAT